MNHQLKEDYKNLSVEKEKLSHFISEETERRKHLEDKQADDVLKPVVKFDTFYDVEINCESIL